MIGIVICSHGNVSQGLVDAVEMIYGACPNLTYLGLEESDDIELWGRELDRLVRVFPKGCVVLHDLFGGTPCNQFLSKIVSDSSLKVYAIAGVNLGMVLYALDYQDTNDPEKLAKLLVEAGKNAVINVSEKWTDRRGK